MTIYDLTFIDADNTSGFNFGSAQIGTGAVFTPTDTDIVTLQVNDDDGYLDPQGTDPGGTVGTAVSDTSSLGTTGYEAGELVQYFSAYELVGSDGTTGYIYYMSNYSGSGIQGVTSTIPFTSGVTYTVGLQVTNAPLPYSSVTPCFTRGTGILTDVGEILIEDLSAGDHVRTKNGLRPIRWIGSTKRQALHSQAPILIQQGTLDNTRDLKVSPQHRMLISGLWVELLFGVPEVLATAKSLINDGSIRRVEGGVVEYFHILFDTHEIVFANGSPSESFHPGELGLEAMGRETRDEILELFPELIEGSNSYMASAHLSLKSFEGELLARCI